MTDEQRKCNDEAVCAECEECWYYYMNSDTEKVVLDEDNDGYVDELHYDYEPKFCPECGAKVKEG